MGFTGFFFLALALAMDCFSVSITCGMVQKRMGRQVIAMAFLFGFFQALMPFAGWLAADLFASQIEAYDHWIAFGLLSFLGGRMVWGTFRNDEVDAGLQPSSLRVLLTLAVATSIDALAVGFSFTAMGIHRLADCVFPLLLIGMVSAVMSVVGKYIGVRLGKRFNFPAECIGGIILILIGFRVLAEHLAA